MPRRAKDDAPPDIPPPPDSSLGLGPDWMLGQRTAMFDAARERTVQDRLKISYRLTPVFTPTPLVQTFSTPPNIPNPLFLGS